MNLTTEIFFKVKVKVKYTHGCREAHNIYRDIFNNSGSIIMHRLSESESKIYQDIFKRHTLSEVF